MLLICIPQRQALRIWINDLLHLNAIFYHGNLHSADVLQYFCFSQISSFASKNTMLPVSQTDVSFSELHHIKFYENQTKSTVCIAHATEHAILLKNRKN